MMIDSRVIKKVLYRVDSEAKKDEEFVECINMLLHVMADEQVKYAKKHNINKAKCK